MELSLLRIVFGMTVPLLILAIVVNIRLERVQKKLDQLEHLLRDSLVNNPAEKR